MIPQVAPILHLDWIQIMLKWVNKYEPVFNKKYKVKRLDITTRHFKQVDEVYIRGKRLVTLTSKPASGILDPDMIVAKFDNWVCYDSNMHIYVLDFLQSNQFEFISFSRVDFCADFNDFDNGMRPDKFIKKYVGRKLLRLGRTPHVAHHFGQAKTEHFEKGLKFGSNLSEVTAYIYNKTLEMNVVKWKPYIWKCWSDGGLDVKRDVWRVELSIKSGGKLIANTETGELDLLLSLQLMSYEYIYKCFYKLYERYFFFVWNDGKSRKDRMRVVKLFNYIYSDEVLVNAEVTETADRSKKIFIKKLDEMNKEMRGTDILMNMELDKFKRKLIEDAGLETWAMKNGLNQ